MKGRHQKRQLNEFARLASEPLLPVLEPWVYETGSLGEMLKHPLVFELAVRATPGLANDYYRRKRAAVFDHIRANDWPGILHFYERPYRMEKLEWMWKRGKITVEELRLLLAHQWIDTEMPQVNQDDPVFLFREAGFTTDDQDGWGTLSDPLPLYRGVDWQYELTEDGPSWTTSVKIARFFAYRLGGDERGGSVFRYVANKAEALAYFSGRNESEVILDFERVSSPRDIYIIERERKAV